MRVRSLLLASLASCLFLATTCPTPDSFPPPRMPAPSITALEVTGIKTTGGVYRGAIHVRWTLQGSDSLPVETYVVLRQRLSSDSAFGVMHYNIPDSITDDYDIINAKDLPDQEIYTTVSYRVFAVDTLGRPSDTSAIDSIRLSWPPRVQYPLDTLKKNSFKWATILYRQGYFTYMYLWSAAADSLWASPRPAVPTYGHETEDSFSVQLPSSLYPLATGTYYCGFKVEIPGQKIETILVRQFYAP